MQKPQRDFFKEYFDPPRPTPEEYERVNKMTIGERLEETLQLTQEFRQQLMKEPPEYVNAFCEAVRRDHEEGNRRMLEGLSEAARRDEQPKKSAKENLD